MTISMQQARDVLEAAKVRAVEMGIAVNITVVDAYGFLQAFERMDGAVLATIDVSQRKAKTAALFRMRTEELGELTKADGAARGVDIVSNGGAIVFAGGIPLNASDGTVVGAIGISGGEVSEDAIVASAGRAAFMQ